MNAVLYTAYLAVLVWLGVKLFYKIRYDVPLTRSASADDVWFYYYPELRTSGLAAAHPAPDDAYFDVLLLGGSVLEQAAPAIERELQGRFENVRVYNLCKSAHTSRDSFLKHHWLGDRRFDLIVIYHGINDVRMNCCPPDVFREDYTHCGWYAGMQRRLKAGSIILSDLGAIGDANLIPLGQPEGEMLDRGARLKTGPAFRANIEGIVTKAKRHATGVVLATFAIHIPEDYSERRFRAGLLDYGGGPHKLPVELWGRPANVRSAVAAHNAAIRNISERYDNVTLVEIARRLPDNGRHFCDPCHLTERGVNVFARIVVDKFVTSAQ